MSRARLLIDLDERELQVLKVLGAQLGRSMSQLGREALYETYAAVRQLRDSIEEHDEPTLAHQEYDERAVQAER